MVDWEDQQRLEPIRSATTRFLIRVQQDVGPVAYQLVDKSMGAMEFQLMADYRYRAAERVEALGLERERARAARRTADRYNDVCLDLLTDGFPAAIEEVRQEFGGQTIDIRESLAIFEQEGREQIAGMDLKGEHAAMAGRTLTETVALANGSGINGLCDYLQDHASQLAELRRRRPEHNDPTAVIIGGILCGIGAIILAICWAVSGPGGCTNPFVIGLAIGFFGAGALVLLSALGVFLAA